VLFAQKRNLYPVVLRFLIIFFSVSVTARPSREEVEVSLGAMGRLRGVVTHSKPYPDQQAPHYARPIYMFRNIPYAEHSVAGERRFTQSVVRTSPYSLPGTRVGYAQSDPLLDFTKYITPDRSRRVAR
jgi:hypothetical protein